MCWLPTSCLRKGLRSGILIAEIVGTRMDPMAPAGPRTEIGYEVINGLLNRIPLDGRKAILPVQVGEHPDAKSRVGLHLGDDRSTPMDQSLGAARNRNTELPCCEHALHDIRLVSPKAALADDPPEQLTDAQWVWLRRPLLADVDDPGAQDPLDGRRQPAIERIFLQAS